MSHLDHGRVARRVVEITERAQASTISRTVEGAIRRVPALSPSLGGEMDTERYERNTAESSREAARAYTTGTVKIG
jgi:hypothetical protein